MLIKICGIPVSDIVKEGVDVKMNIVDAWELIHVPVNMDIGSATIDMNPTNVPFHIIHTIKPHAMKIIDVVF